MGNIQTVLSKIQSRLRVPKSQFNNFGKYPYRNLEDIQEALKPLLAEHNATVVLNDDIIHMGDRFYVKSTAMLSVDNESISAVAFARESMSKKGMDEAQITGSTSSYARKYAMGGLLAIDDNRDPDANTVPIPDNVVHMKNQTQRRTNEDLPVNPNGATKAATADSKKAPVEKANQAATGPNHTKAGISAAQRTAIVRLASQKNVTDEQLNQVIKAEFKATSLEELTTSDASMIIRRLQARA